MPPEHRSLESGFFRSSGLQSPVSGLQSPVSGLQSPVRTSRFTLVELLVALVILSIMMIMLFRFTAAAQDAWAKSSANMRIYQNARAAMDLIEQDLRAIVFSGETGAEIKAHLYDSGADSHQITFVAAVGEDAAYDSELVEVSYQKSGDILQRAEVGDNLAGGAWNFLGAPASWHSNGPPSYEDVIGGIQDLEFTGYNSAGAAITVENDYTNIASISISFTIRDEKPAPDTIAKQAERTFTKTVYLNR